MLKDKLEQKNIETRDTSCSERVQIAFSVPHTLFYYKNLVFKNIMASKCPKIENVVVISLVAISIKKSQDYVKIRGFTVHPVLDQL